MRAVSLLGLSYFHFKRLTEALDLVPFDAAYQSLAVVSTALGVPVTGIAVTYDV